MPNISSILNGEISRIARKAVRGEIVDLKKSLSAYRSEIASLKRRCLALEQQLRHLSRAGVRAAPTESAKQAEGAASTSQSLRFSAKGLASQRQRLGLSAEDCGLLVGASGQSVYKWEAGKARPRAKHLQAIAALRAMGKKEALARLVSLKSQR